MPYQAPDAANPRVQRTRKHLLATARELLTEAGPIGLTYSTLAERSGNTRQTVYRHWTSRSAILVDLILDGPPVGYPAPGKDLAAVAVAWLSSVRAGMQDRARRAAVLAVSAQADSDPECAQALMRITEDRLAALNVLLEPSGTRLATEEYALLTGPLLSRIFFERGHASDQFLEHVVTRWLAGREARGERPVATPGR